MANLGKFKLFLFLALLLVSGARADWSWGKNANDEGSKVEEKTQPEKEPAAAVEDNSEGAGRSLLVPTAVLPIEEHSSFPASASEISEDVVGEEGRNARFLGISEKLCKLGVKGMCAKPKGYPPAPSGYYGNILPTGSSYNSYSPNVHTPHKKYPPSFPHGNVAPPKPPKKLFGSVFKNKHNKGSYPAPLPTYGTPSQGYDPPKPVYQPPVTNYGPPKPVYQAPLPAYSAPKPHHYKPPQKFYPKPKPVYAAPKPSYKQPNRYPAFDTPKPTDIVLHKAQHAQHSIPTHIVSGIAPSKVQHIHTHTHIYNQQPHIDIRNRPSFSRNDGTYQASSEIKTTINRDSSLVSNSFPSIKTGKVFDSQIKASNSFGDSFKPSQSVPFITTGFQASQDKRHISQKAINPKNFNSFGVKEQHSFQGQQQSFQGQPQSFQGQQQSFQGQPQSFPGQQQSFQGQQQSFQGQQQSFQESIQNVANSFASNGLGRAYPEDCQCVPRQYCTPDHLVARTVSKDIDQLLDARNQPTDIVSNSTLSEDYYDYDYLHSEDDVEEREGDISITTMTPDETSEDTTTSIEEDVSSTTTEVSTTTTEESKRVRRDVLEEETNKTSGLEGRQLTGFTPGINGCGPDHVCCRRPVYVAAKRLPPTCGRGNPSIHGRVSTFQFEKGQSDFGEYPWQAAILRDEGIESMFVCGATLIDNYHILTAAHCVNDLNVETLKVRLGEWDVNRDTEFYKHAELRVQGVFVHPEFYKGNLYNDIAVVRLANYVDTESNPHISPVCLPARNTDFTNYKCHVTGWGKNAFGDNGKFQHILKELEINVVDQRTCEFALQSTRLGKDYKLHDGFICAGGEEGKDACKGDGGGPLVCSVDGKTFQLAGIVSWGIGCGQKGIPGVYVNIPHYVDWIQSIVRA